MSASGFFLSVSSGGAAGCAGEPPVNPRRAVPRYFRFRVRAISGGGPETMSGGRNPGPRAVRQLALLLVLLGGLLAAAEATGGNDAISLAPKLKPADGKDLQQDGEDEGGARPDKDFDFAAYVNGEFVVVVVGNMEIRRPIGTSIEIEKGLTGSQGVPFEINMAPAHASGMGILSLVLPTTGLSDNDSHLQMGDKNICLLGKNCNSNLAKREVLRGGGHSDRTDKHFKSPLTCCDCIAM